MLRRTEQDNDQENLQLIQKAIAKRQRESMPCSLRFAVGMLCVTGVAVKLILAIGLQLIIGARNSDPKPYKPDYIDMIGDWYYSNPWVLITVQLLRESIQLPTKAIASYSQTLAMLSCCKREIGQLTLPPYAVDMSDEVYMRTVLKSLVTRETDINEDMIKHIALEHVKSLMKELFSKHFFDHSLMQLITDYREDMQLYDHNDRRVPHSGAQKILQLFKHLDLRVYTQYVASKKLCTPNVVSHRSRRGRGLQQPLMLMQQANSQQERDLKKLIQYSQPVSSALRTLHHCANAYILIMMVIGYSASGYKAVNLISQSLAPDIDPNKVAVFFSAAALTAISIFMSGPLLLNNRGKQKPITWRNVWTHLSVYRDDQENNALLSGRGGRAARGCLKTTLLMTGRITYTSLNVMLVASTFFMYTFQTATSMAKFFTLLHR